MKKKLPGLVKYPGRESRTGDGSYIKKMAKERVAGGFAKVYAGPEMLRRIRDQEELPVPSAGSREKPVMEPVYAAPRLPASDDGEEGRLRRPLRRKRICPACGRLCRSSDAECPGCGAELPQVPDIQER